MEAHLKGELYGKEHGVERTEYAVLAQAPELKGGKTEGLYFRWHTGGTDTCLPVWVHLRLDKDTGVLIRFEHDTKALDPRPGIIRRTAGLCRRDVPEHMQLLAALKAGIPVNATFDRAACLWSFDWEAPAAPLAEVDWVTGLLHDENAGVCYELKGHGLDIHPEKDTAPHPAPAPQPAPAPAPAPGPPPRRPFRSFVLLALVTGLACCATAYICKKQDGGKIQELNHKLIALSGEKSALQEEYDHLKSKLRQVQSPTPEQKAKEEDLKRDIENLKKEARDKAAEADLQRQNAEKQFREKERYRDLVEEKDEEIRELESEIESLKEEIKDLQSESSQKHEEKPKSGWRKIKNAVF